MHQESAFLPFSYQVHGKRPRFKAEVHTVVEELAARIPFITASEAPIAARATPRNGTAEIIHRVWNGMFVAPLPGVRTQAFGDKPRPLDFDTFSRLLVELRSKDLIWSDYPIPMDLWESGHLRSADIRLEHMKFKTVESNTRLERLVQAQRVASGFVVVDGVVHAPVPELVWTINPLGSTGVELALEEATPVNRLDVGWCRETFRADRGDDALRLAKVISRRENRPLAVMHDLNDTGCLPFEFDDVGLSIQWAFRSFMETIAANKASELAWLPPEFYPLLVKIREFSEMPVFDRESAANVLRQASDVLRERDPRADVLAGNLRRPLIVRNFRYQTLDKIGAGFPAEDSDALASWPAL